MNEPAIHAQELTRRFGEFVAVDRVTFQVQPGEIAGYLGPNGCGKTTTIRMLLGLLLPSGGQARVLGYEIASQSEQIRACCGYMSQKFALYDDLTVWENLRFYGGVYGITAKTSLQKTLAHVELTGHEGYLAGELSTGWRQRLALAIALVHSPQLLFLDEPTSGVDPNARRSFWDLIYTLAAEGVTILVTTHYMDEAEYCNRVGIMRTGKLLAMDTPSELKQQFVKGDVFEIYLSPLLPGLSALEANPFVQRAGLAGDHLRVVVNKSINWEEIKRMLAFEGIQVEGIHPGETSLEDVFIHLAKDKGEKN